MSKKKSEAAILSLLDSFSKAGLTTIEDEETATRFNVEETIDEENINSTIIQKTKNSKNFEQLITIIPKKCKPWHYADRLPTEMGNIEELASSIKNHGQQEPILVRPIPPDKDGIEFEIIFGNRRWHACTLIGKPLKAIVKNLTDQEAAICQKEENENREGLSDYSRALSYKRLLDNGIFSSISELSAKMNIPKTTIIDLMAYNRIKPEILKAMPDLGKLTRRCAIKLASISTEINDNTLKAVITLAPQINSGKIPSSKIQQHIENFLSGKEKKVYSSSVLIKNKFGEPLFTSKVDGSGNLSIAIHKTVKDKISKEKIENVLMDFMENCMSEKWQNLSGRRADQIQKGVKNEI